VKNTPTFFINGTQLRGAFTPENLRAAIDAALAGKQSP
jgi:protein-disulfide isomerase